MLKINIGSESRPVIEGINEYNDSIFKHQYSNAFRLIQEVTNNQDIAGSEINSNIIAFCGDRGSGKTSCMQSVANIIHQYENPPKNEKGRSHNESSLFGCCKGFEILDIIDPSFFDEKHNIIQIIVGSLFHQFKEVEKKRRKDEDNDLIDKTKIIKCFSELHSSLHYLDTAIAHSEYCKDDIEQLELLSNGLNLKDKIKELIKLYLKFVGKEFLVIQVDDIDLNTSQAYEMAEQIRKYLIQPKVVLLVAVKPDQMLEVVEQHLVEKFEQLLKYKGIDMASIRTMAERYVAKLFPVGNRIAMPVADVLYDDALEIHDANEDSNKKTSNEDANGLSNNLIKDKVTELIEEKTGIKFYNINGQVSLVIPNNLRALCHLIKFIYSMKTPGQDEKIKDQNISDLYLYLNSHFKPMLSGDYLKAFEIIYSVKDVTKLNKIVVNETGKLINGIINPRSYVTIDTIEKTENPVLADILNPQNNRYNISLGDAFALLNYFETIDVSYFGQLYAFMVKFIYTIQLTRMYKHSGVTSANDMDNVSISPYQQLLGGSLITIVNNEIMPPTKATDSPTLNEARDVRLVDGEQLGKIIKKIKNYGKTVNNDDRASVITAEFFMLSISRYMEIKSNKDAKDNGTRKFRLLTDVYYSRNLSNAKNVIFDVLFPLFSVHDIKAAYSRFDDDIYDILINKEYSLCNKIKKSQVNYLNNSEQILELYSKLCKQRTKLKNSNSIKSYIDLYGNLQKVEHCGSWPKVVYDELIWINKNGITNDFYKVFGKDDSTSDKPKDKHKVEITDSIKSIVDSLVKNVNKDKKIEQLINSLKKDDLLSKEITDFDALTTNFKEINRLTDEKIIDAINNSIQINTQNLETVD